MTTRTRVSTILTEMATCAARLHDDELEEALESLASAPRLFLAGTGRSGCVVRAFANRLMHLGRPVHVLGEITTPSTAPGDLLVIASGSGATPSLCLLAERARAQELRVLLLTATSGSPLDQLAHLRVVFTGTASKINDENTAQPMGSAFEQLLFVVCDALVQGLMPRLDQDVAALKARHATLE